MFTNLYQRNARFWLLFCEKNFFKMISLFVILICQDRKKLLSCLYEAFFLVLCGNNVGRQLATSSDNLVASAQFLVALATSESQF